MFQMGCMLSISVGTTAVESLSAAGNIFLGQIHKTDNNVSVSIKLSIIQYSKQRCEEQS